eukprot:57149-Amphidinium_carterae.2
MAPPGCPVSIGRQSVEQHCLDTRSGLFCVVLRALVLACLPLVIKLYQWSDLGAFVVGRMSTPPISDKHTRYLKDVWALLDSTCAAVPKPSHAPDATDQAFTQQAHSLPGSALAAAPGQDGENDEPDEQGFENAEADHPVQSALAEVMSHLDGRLERSFQSLADQLSLAQIEQLIKMVKQLVDFKNTIGRVLDMQGEILSTLRTLSMQTPSQAASSASTGAATHALQPPAELPPIGSPMHANAMAKKRPQPHSKGQKGKGRKISVLSKFR